MKGSGEEDFGVLVRDLFRAERAFLLVPLIEPVNHAQQGKGGRPRAHSSENSPILLNLRNDRLQKTDIALFAGVDLLAKRRRQRVILVQQDRDLSVAGAQHDVDVQAD